MRTITKETLFKITFKNTSHKHIFEPLFETKLCIRSYRDENHYKDTFSKSLSKNTSHKHFF